MKSSASQEDYLFSVISADPSTAEIRFPAKESNYTQCGHDIQPAVSEADPFLCLNGQQRCEEGRDMLSFNPDFRTFHFVRMYQQ